MTLAELRRRWPGWDIDVWQQWGGLWDWRADLPDSDDGMTGMAVDTKAEAIARVDEVLTVVRSRDMRRAR